MFPIPYLKLATYALSAIIGFGIGWKIHSWKADAAALAQMEADNKAVQAAVEQAKKIASLRDANIQTAAQLEIERNKAAQIVTKEVIRDVIRYVQKPSSQSVCLDSDGVRLINTASGGVPTDTNATGTSDATAAAVVASVTDNYAICNSNANQLRALQDWVRAIK